MKLSRRQFFDLVAGAADRPAHRNRPILRSGRVLLKLGTMVLVGSPAGFGEVIAAETEKWDKAIRAASIKPE